MQYLSSGLRGLKVLIKLNYLFYLCWAFVKSKDYYNWDWSLSPFVTKSKCIQACFIDFKLGIIIPVTVRNNLESVASLLSLPVQCRNSFYPFKCFRIFFLHDYPINWKTSVCTSGFRIFFFGRQQLCFITVHRNIRRIQI